MKKPQLAPINKKAKELIKKFNGNIDHAIVCVDEILKAEPMKPVFDRVIYLRNQQDEFWEAIKKELISFKTKS